jgi:hypothetical protein
MSFKNWIRAIETNVPEIWQDYTFQISLQGLNRRGGSCLPEMKEPPRNLDDIARGFIHVVDHVRRKYAGYRYAHLRKDVNAVVRALGPLVEAKHKVKV